MKKLVILIALVSQYGMAARISGATWSPSAKSITLSMSFEGGCLAHNFTIDWDVCAADGTRFGQIVDSGGNDQCTEELSQVFESQEPNDGCVSGALILKATSSKAPVIVQK